jgi:SAM-dependent methyltransferase
MQAFQATQAGPRGAGGALEIAPAGGDTATPRNLRKRLDLLEALLPPLPGLRVLDAGCGAGEYVRALVARGADALGIECSEEKLALARDLPAALGRRIRPGDLQEIDFGTGRFDAALLNEVLEHVPDDRAALREAFRLLRPGGALVVFAPNRLFPFETHGLHLRRSGRPVSHVWPGLPWLPLSLLRVVFRPWARNYWPWQLARMLRESGFAVRHRGFAWPTFENISGRQPRWLRPLAGALRAVGTLCARVPVLCAFGASQLLIGAKGEVSA